MKKQLFVIGLSTMILLSGCTINITKNITAQQEETPKKEIEQTEEVQADVPVVKNETPELLQNVEEYVENTVRPIYYSITENQSLRSVSEGEKTWYYDGKMVVKLKYAAGEGGIRYERDYYFHPQSGELLFAFVFLGQEEYRLYFYQNELVRYVGPGGVTEDNPTDPVLLGHASDAVSEAYVR